MIQPFQYHPLRIWIGCGAADIVCRGSSFVMSLVPYTGSVAPRFSIEHRLEVMSTRDHSEKRGSVEYWLRQPPEARIAAVEFLRQQFHEPGTRLRRVLRVTDRASR